MQIWWSNPYKMWFFWKVGHPNFFQKYVPLVVSKLYTKFQQLSLSKTAILKNPLYYFTLACLKPSALKGTHHNFVVHAPTIMKLGTDMELDVLHTMVTKHFATMLLLSNYDAITGIYADVYASWYYILVTPEALDWYSRGRKFRCF